MKLHHLLLLTLGLLSAGGAWAQEIASQCPDGWLTWQRFCYLFVNGTTATWSEAGDECAVRQAHLLRVETSDEYEFVKKGLLMYASDAYWTALNDLPINQPPNPNKIQGTGVFMWGSDERTDDSVVKQHWNREPDNVDYKDCVIVNMQGAMAVQDCNKRRAYICQITLRLNEGCPTGGDIWWTPSYDGTTCYYFSNASFPALVNWDEARKRCESMTPIQGDTTRKASLLAVNSADTKTFLSQQLPLAAMTNQGYWIGLNDKNREGVWQWAGNIGVPYNKDFINWRVEPNNLGGKEFCGALLPNGEWNDRKCDARLNFACRINLPDQPQEWSMGCGAWTRAGRKCVYVYSKPTRTWLDARAHCQGMGGDLMKFDNEDDTLWLRMQSSQSVMPLSGYWIGLNDRQVENTFLWADGSWAPGYLLDWDKEPNNFARQGRFVQDCAVMAYDGNFLDQNCARQKAGAICEEATSVCAPGWQKYNDHCYLFDATSRFKTEAQDNCHDQSATGTARLFALNTQDEKDWLVKQMNSLPTVPTTVWCDLTDISLEGDWHWAMAADDDSVVTQKLVTWTNEPNDWKGNEDCVQVDMNGHLNDVDCSHSAGFVCQRSLNGGRPLTSSFVLLLIVFVVCRLL